MPVTSEGVFYPDNSTEMSVADILAAMAQSISEQLAILRQGGIVASASERDLLYPVPVQGNTVFRKDLGARETYFELYNQVTNPGGKPTAGWYTELRIFTQTAEPAPANGVSPRNNDIWLAPK